MLPGIKTPLPLLSAGLQRPATSAVVVGGGGGFGVGLEEGGDGGEGTNRLLPTDDVATRRILFFSGFRHTGSIGSVLIRVPHRKRDFSVRRIVSIWFPVHPLGLDR
jgi:hypothetical protein